jgi:hypothetical protein
VRPEAVDDADDLVARHHTWTCWHQVTFGQMQVCAADAAGKDAQEDLVRPGLGDVDLHRNEGTGIDRSGAIHSPRTHEGFRRGREACHRARP